MSLFPIPASPPYVPMLALTEPLHGAVQFNTLTENEPLYKALSVMPRQPSAPPTTGSGCLASCLAFPMVCCSPVADAAQHANSGEGE